MDLECGTLPSSLKAWRRGEEQLTLLRATSSGAHEQPMRLVALVGSGSTPREGIKGSLVVARDPSEVSTRLSVRK
jgi:hypothetical protein